MQYVIVFLLAILVLGIFAALLGSAVGAELEKGLFPEDLPEESVLPPAKLVASGQIV